MQKRNTPLQPFISWKRQGPFFHHLFQVTPELVEVLRAPLLMEGALESTLETWQHKGETSLDEIMLGWIMAIVYTPPGVPLVDHDFLKSIKRFFVRVHSYQNMFSFMSHTVYGSCFCARCTSKHPCWYQIRNIMQWYIMFIFSHDTQTGHTFWTSFFVRSFILRTSCLTPQGPCWNSFLRWRFGWLRFDKCTTRCKLDLSCQSGQLRDDTCIELYDDLLALFFLLVSVCPLGMV